MFRGFFCSSPNLVARYPRQGLNPVSPEEEAKRDASPAIASFLCFGEEWKMRRMATGKRTASWALVAVIGVVGSYSWTAYAASLEDSQPAAGVIVTKAKDLAKVQADRPRGAPETEVGIQASGDQVNATLSSCSDQARRSFLESLVLVDGKFAGAHVRTIQECLGEAGYKKFRDLFGSQTPTTKDNADHWCASRATCSNSNDICTSNCRSSNA